MSLDVSRRHPFVRKVFKAAGLVLPPAHARFRISEASEVSFGGEYTIVDRALGIKVAREDVPPTRATRRGGHVFTRYWADCVYLSKGFAVIDPYLAGEHIYAIYVGWEDYDSLESTAPAAEDRLLLAVISGVKVSMFSRADLAGLALPETDLHRLVTRGYVRFTGGNLRLTKAGREACFP